MIRLENICKTYNNIEVLHHISFEVANSEFLVLVGESGSGKTTTLKMMNRLVEPTSGTVFMDDQDLSTRDLRETRLEIGYVLQQIALFPNLTVAENIALIPKMKGWKKATIITRTHELLEKVGLTPDKYLHRYPKDLSGGEQQRVGILRAIIANPKLLLMDEPFSALDPISRRQLQDLMLELQKELGMTIVFVTHDVDEARKLADRIAVFEQGKLVQIAKINDILQSPATESVANLFKGAQHD